MVSAIHLKSVSHRHAGEDEWLYENFSLEVNAGECCGLLGKTGAGKSTVLGLMLGEVLPSSGRVERAAELSGPGAMACAYQNGDDSVFPWLTVEQNLRQPLRKLGWLAADAQARGEELLAGFELGHRRRAWPQSLSGGEMIRLGLARALANRPAFVGIDEGLSALDARTKRDVTALLAREFENAGQTAVVIAHNFSEILSLARRCVVLSSTRPVRILDDFRLELPFPRDARDPAYQTAEIRLFEALRSEVP